MGKITDFHYSSVLPLLSQRRSVFPPSFKEGEIIPREHIEIILEAANWAPNHGSTEPWRFKVAIGKRKITLAQELVEAYIAKEGEQAKDIKIRKIKANCERSSAVIAIVGLLGTKAKIPEWEEIAAIGMAVQNLYLQASSMGYGGYWSSPKFMENPLLYQALKLEEGERLFGFFYLGVPDGEIPEGHRKTSALEKTLWL